MGSEMCIRDRVIAGARTPDGKTRLGLTQAMLKGELPPALQAGMATTIGVVATDAQLTKAQAQKLAQQAHDGLARTIDPVHTMWDGDTIFCIGTGKSGVTGNMMALGAIAAQVMGAAVIRAVLAAKGVSIPGGPAIPSVAELG